MQRCFPVGRNCWEEGVQPLHWAPPPTTTTLKLIDLILSDNEFLPLRVSEVKWRRGGVSEKW